MAFACAADALVLFRPSFAYLPYPFLVGWNAKEMKLEFQSNPIKLIPWMLVTVLGIFGTGAGGSAYVLMMQYFAWTGEQVGYRRMKAANIVALIGIFFSSGTILIASVLMAIYGREVVIGFNYLREFEENFTRGFGRIQRYTLPRNEKPKRNRRNLRSLILRLHILAHGMGGLIIPMGAIIENFDPYYPIIDAYISDPKYRDVSGIIGFFFGRLLLAIVCMSECIRLAGFGGLVILTAVSIYMHTLKDLRNLPGDMLKYEGKHFRKQYIKLKLIHACLKLPGNSFIFLLMGYAVIALTFLLWTTVKLFGDVEIHVYLVFVGCDLVIIAFIEATLPTAVLIEEMSEEVIHKWKYSSLSLQLSERRFLAKASMALRPISWSAGTLIRLDRSSRVRFYNAIFDNVVNGLLTI